METSQLFGYAHAKTHTKTTAGSLHNSQTAAVDDTLANASSAIPSIEAGNIAGKTHAKGHHQQHCAYKDPTGFKGNQADW